MFRGNRLKHEKGSKEKGGKTGGGGDPDYEEIRPQRTHSEHLNKEQKNEEEVCPCDLCGSSEAAVRCEKCNCQAFCSTCDETFHGHPKRSSHVRKALSEEVGPNKPPLPRKGPDGSIVSPPQPPPRKNKKGGILATTFGIKEQGENDTGRTLMGSLKKMMGNRPLPPPPDLNLEKRRNSTPPDAAAAAAAAAAKSPNAPRPSNSSTLNNESGGLKVALPQSIMDINNKSLVKKPPSSMPPTPPSATHAQYPKVQVSSPFSPTRKLSLQQLPSSIDDKRASVVESSPQTNNASLAQQQQQQEEGLSGMIASKARSQSISDEHWNKMFAMHGSHLPQGPVAHPGFMGNVSEVGGVSLPRRAFNTMIGGAATRPFGRGMVSSASVCDLNSLAQQQQQHQQQQQQHHHQQQQQQQQQQHPHGFPTGMNSANSFQQLSLMSYDPNMVWVQPSPCNMCQPQHAYPQAMGPPGGMKRTASNISMNLSSVGSDVSGAYPWAPHAHHHMPLGYPGYYPGCHQHMVGPGGFSQGSSMSIPDSMRSYNRMPSSPAPSARSSSHRSHKSSKSKSFSANEVGRRSRNHSRKRSEESEEEEDSLSSSVSDEEPVMIPPSKPAKPGSLAWQCDHCTFINPGHVSACGMCSKVPGKSSKVNKRGSDRRRKSDLRRRDRKADVVVENGNDDDISDYDNDDDHPRKDSSRRDARLKSTGSVKSSSGRSKKKKSRRRGESSPSRSSSDSESEEEEEEDEGIQLEKQLKDLRLSSRSRVEDYDRYSSSRMTKDTDKEERRSLKREGGGSRYRNRRRYHSDRSMTPSRRSSLSRRSRKASVESENSSENISNHNNNNQVVSLENKSSLEGTLIATTASESNTLKGDRSGQLKHWSGSHSLDAKQDSSGGGSSKSSELEDPFDSSHSEGNEGQNHHKSEDESNEDEQVRRERKSSLEENDEIEETKIEKTKVPEHHHDLYQPLEKDGDDLEDQNREEEEEEPYKNYNKLNVSNPKIDVEEPSFANTLDGIETMGTNEVADYEPSHMLEDKLDPESMTKEINALIPTAVFENRQTPERRDQDPEFEVKDEVEVDHDTNHDRKLGNEECYQDNHPVQVLPADRGPSEDTSSRAQVSKEPSYEQIEAPDEGRRRKSVQVSSETNENTAIEVQQKFVVAQERQMAEQEEAAVAAASNGGDEGVMSRDKSGSTTSSENSNNEVLLSSPLRERQLSLSSSDAQFYSPPNSPDLSSLSDHQLGKRNKSGSQTVRRDQDDDLVTAFETIQQLEEGGSSSSRDTIRSSNEQLNDEIFDDGDLDLDEGYTKLPEDTFVTVPSSKEVGEGYDTVAFQDSQSSYQQFPLTTDQSILEDHNQESDSETRPRPAKEPRPAVIPPPSDEEEVDERNLTVEQIINKRKRRIMKEEGLHLVQLLREAEEKGYNPEDVSVAMKLCDKNENPVDWLEENLALVVDTVRTQASKYAAEKREDFLGEISGAEAKRALRAHKGDVWAAVKECVEQRRIKCKELEWNGKFKREEIIRSLTKNDGDSEKTLADLTEAHQQSGASFFSKIWGGFIQSTSKVMQRTEGRRSSPGRSEVVESSEVEQSTHTSTKLISVSNPSDEEMVEAAGSDLTEGSSLTDSDKEQEIYANFVNPLLEKLSENISHREEETPVISEELKRKIVQAIFEGDDEAPGEAVVFDSDEESTIEELLAVAENPTFYDYFTAVDLEDFEEISEAHDEVNKGETRSDSASSGSYDSPGTLSGTEEDDLAREVLSTEEVTSEFEYGDEFKSTENITPGGSEKENGSEERQRENSENDLPGQKEKEGEEEEEEIEGDQAEGQEPFAGTEAPDTPPQQEIQFIREEDVVVHPKKTYGRGVPVPPLASNEDWAGQGRRPQAPPHSWNEDAHNGAKEVDLESPKRLPASKDPDHPVPVGIKSGVPTPPEDTRGPRPYSKEGVAHPEDNVSSWEDERGDSVSEDEEESTETGEVVSEGEEEEEAVSVTTGRLSLSLTQSVVGRGTNIDVKSQMVQTNQLLPAPHHQAFGEETGAETPNKVSTPARGRSEGGNANPAAAEVDRLPEPQMGEGEPETEGAIISTPIETDNPDGGGPPKASGGPATTVQKATLIVGKAIAKAMARESSVRRDSVSSETSSQLGASSTSTPESEDLPEFPQSVTSESEEDLLGSLDTIPEEDEISERTQSGRMASRSSTKSSNSTTQPAPAGRGSRAPAIPSAVASYSGPIFIPSSSSAFSDTTTNSSKPKNVEPRGKQGAIAAPPLTTASVGGVEPPGKQGAIAAPPLTNSSVAGVEPRGKQGAIAAPPLTTTAPVGGVEPRGKQGVIAVPPVTAASVTDRSKEMEVREVVEKSDQETSSDTTVKPATRGKLPGAATAKTSQNKETKTQEQKKNDPKPNKQKKTQDANESQVTKTKKSGASKKNSKSQNGGKPQSAPSSSNAPLTSTLDAPPPSAKKPPTVPKKVVQVKGKSAKGSSGESDEEELGTPDQTLQKLEGLKTGKGKDPDYQDVQELKQQIQIMRQELESKIDENDDTSNYSESLTGGLDSPSGPVIVLQKPSEDPQTAGDAEERTEGITDQDIEQYEQLKFDRTVRRLLAEGQATSYEKAELAAQLLNLSFDETDSIQAAEGCSSIYTALQFLQQECELCAEKYPMGKMVSMLHCIHRCCDECANTYFSFQIKTRNIRELRCPFCNEPDLDASEETAAEYLNNLDILLKNILDKETHELFQRKLRDWTLMKDPNFRWCSKCSSGFIANPRARKLICPDCKDVTCAQCRKQWEAQHTGITCEAFAKWKEENDPEAQAEGVAKHLAECGITCPSCKFTYSLAKGGCMHFTCTECKYEFCSGCSQPFKQGSKCHIGPYCERLGLHAHHPRNCLFYLRDKEPGQLQQLLKDHNIEFDTESPPGLEDKRVCRVQEQKETADGLRDDICGRVTLEGNAGLCKLHYIEYLVEKINSHGLDPVCIFDEADLRVCLRRNGKTVPVRRWESEKLYRDKLIKLIKEQLPLS